MSLSDLMRRYAPIDAPLFSGNWGRVIYQPDLLVPQTFDIGIVVQDARRTHFKIVSGVSRFRCVYANSHSDQWNEKIIEGVLRRADAVLKTAFERAVAPDFDSLAPNVWIDWVGQMKGDAPEMVCRDLFSRTIVMEPPLPVGKQFVAMSNGQVAEKVQNMIRQMVSQAKYPDLVTQALLPVYDNPAGDEIEEAEQSCHFRTDMGFGAVASAMYKKPDSVQSHILEQKYHLDILSKHKGGSNQALFIRIPGPDTEGISKNTIDMIVKRAKSRADYVKLSGITSFCEASDDALAARAIEWIDSSVSFSTQ